MKGGNVWCISALETWVITGLLLLWMCCSGCILYCQSSYLSSAFWSHCKQTTASLSCPDHLRSCYKQMLRSFCLWAGVTVVDRLHKIQHRNSVSTEETWAHGGVNPARRNRTCSPSAKSASDSEEKKGAMTLEPWLCLVRGSLRVGWGELLDECMRFTGSSVNNETLPGSLRHIRFWQRPSQPANQRQMRLLTSLPTMNRTKYNK